MLVSKRQHDGIRNVMVRSLDRLGEERSIKDSQVEGSGGNMGDQPGRRKTAALKTPAEHRRLSP